jgi:putative SOS response-associated peptidase YedK
MCFHSKLTQKASSIEQRFNAKMIQSDRYQSMTDINGFAHPSTPIITNSDASIIQFYEWGLIPAWAKDTSIQNSTLNARIESLNEKPSFKQILHQRCLIISDGFYEWQQLDNSGKMKQKYLIHKADNGVFAFGGLYSLWTDRVSGEIKHTYTIVTTEAQGFMRDIHNAKLRMPVILDKSNEYDWLNKASFDQFTHLPNHMTASKC